MINVDRFLIDIDRVLIDVDQFLIEMDQLLISIDQILIDIDRLLISVDRILIDVDRLLISVDQIVINVDRLLISIDQILIDVDRLSIEAGSVVDPGTGMQPSSVGDILVARTGVIRGRPGTQLTIYDENGGVKQSSVLEHPWNFMQEHGRVRGVVNA